MVKDSPARIDPEEAAIGRPTPTARRLVEARRGHLGPRTWRPCSPPATVRGGAGAASSPSRSLLTLISDLAVLLLAIRSVVTP